MFTGNRLCVLAVVGSLVAIGCSDERVVSPNDGGISPPLLAKGAVVQSVTGSGHFTVGGALRTFAFTARRHTDGSVSGEYQGVRHDLGVAWHGNITCFTIIGTQAWLGGIAESSGGVVIPGTEASWRVVDNGEGQNAPPDQITLQGVNLPPGAAAAYCAATPAGGVLASVEDGNIQVPPMFEKRYFLAREVSASG